MYSNNRISNLITSIVPFFVRNDHPNFILFLEAYYEYLEQNTKTVNRAKNLRTYRDVDLTEDQFAQKLYDTFMKYIPPDVLVDKNLIIKNIKDFYRAKGSEKSTRFLLRILYNIEIDFYYPKKDVLRVSDGKWFIQRSLRISDTQLANVADSSLTTLEKYIGTQISGTTSTATALVERVDRFFEQGTQIDELILSNINRTFINNEKIITIDNNEFLSANIFGGIINTINITNAGTGYQIGDPVLILSNTGASACAFVASVTTGNIASISVLSGGAGYIVNSAVTITGGGGSGATANVLSVDTTETIHPNSYNIVASTISLEAGTPINNTVYSNLNLSNANTTIANAVSFWTYANTGPVSQILVLNSGSNYATKPVLTVGANTVVYSLGILGRMEIVNGGQNYQIGDKIEFINVLGGYGFGALANVTNVNSAQSNSISAIRFEQMQGQIIGGSGYNDNYLPRANVMTTTGNGANIVVKSVLSSGANLTSVSSSMGAIQRIVIQSRGVNYGPNTTVDLSQSGDGTATATASIVEGVYSYPGRYLNDDGHISSYNFIQDRDFYQNFSYVIKSSRGIDSYRNAVKNIIHPSGLKLWGEFQYLSQPDMTTCPCDADDSISRIAKIKSYIKTGNTINVTYTSHNLSTNANVTLEFLSGDYANVRNGIYMIVNTNINHITTNVSYFTGDTSGNVLVGIYQA